MGSVTCLVARQQSHNATQGVPRRLIQGRIGSDQVSNHLPGGYVKSSFGRWSHGKRDRTRGTETDSPCRRFLPRSDPYGLSEHEDTNRFVSDLELAITAQTTQAFHLALHLKASCLKQMLSSPRGHCKWIARFLPGTYAMISPRRPRGV